MFKSFTAVCPAVKHVMSNSRFFTATPTDCNGPQNAIKPGLCTTGCLENDGYSTYWVCTSITVPHVTVQRMSMDVLSALNGYSAFQICTEWIYSICQVHWMDIHPVESALNRYSTCQVCTEWIFYLWSLHWMDIQPVKSALNGIFNLSSALNG